MKKCTVCSGEYERGTRSIGKKTSVAQYIASKFCSMVCRGIDSSKSLLGKNNPNYRGGKSSCEVCKKQLATRYTKEKKCWGCYVTESKKNATGNSYPKCIKCSKKTGDYKSKMCSTCYIGKERPQWRGGVSRLASRIRGLPESRSWIRKCMQRDNFSCMDCGTRAIKSNLLQVHHIYPFAKILKDNNIKSLAEAKRCNILWDTQNGLTLCKPCHKLTDSYSKKI